MKLLTKTITAAVLAIGFSSTVFAAGINDLILEEPIGTNSSINNPFKTNSGSASNGAANNFVWKFSAYSENGYSKDGYSLDREERTAVDVRAENEFNQDPLFR